MRQAAGKPAAFYLFKLFLFLMFICVFIYHFYFIF